jgi:pimeloyl-ACP methyl ester carboxylesterase
MDPQSGTDQVRSERVRANGLDFHVLVCGEGDRLALCLHGFPELGYSWRHQMGVLASLGYRVWAPDLRGYGRTDRPTRLEDYAIETLMEDVGALIDASGAKETTLIAHDWGAIIAWQFAVSQIRELKRLIILNGPALRPRQERPGLFSRQFWRFYYVLLFQIPWLPEWLMSVGDYRTIERMFRGPATHQPERFTDDVIAVYKEGAARPGALTAMINYYRALVRGGGMKRMEAAGFPIIEVPTLILWGERDPILPPEMIAEAKSWAADLTVRFISDAGHWLQQEAPEAVNEELRRWLGDGENSDKFPPDRR